MDEDEFDLEATLAEMNAAMAEIDAWTKEGEAAFAAERAGLDKALAEVEEARRSGSEGRDWQVLQQRIDMRETTLDDIVGGIDQSDEAVAVRAKMSAAIPELRQNYADVLDDPEQSPERAEAEAARAELQKSLEEFDELLRDL
ncbi:hypothetical protein [Protaetiibacter intestinalis]|uniref:Uncharacterized protein n=1 Tax=Protaetiibacter intestinalis TaxID=2419774 RepID=A0A387B7L9_9MICO|nr:hypothetical protein [Protaetiibacter intestinalis]AYF97748.1 hypothetical protein D7I47_05430 [Protaetiibacter intestinalis]